MRRRCAGALALAVLALAGCGSDGDDDGADESVSSDVDPTVIDPGTPAWDPAVPDAPVDPATVTEQYAEVLDLVVERVGSGLTWDDATTTTEQFDDLCVVEVERVADGSLTTPPDELEVSLTQAASDGGFPDLASASDPGGAVLFVAHDDADALLELRSKVGTTVAVRVATADSAC